MRTSARPLLLECTETARLWTFSPVLCRFGNPYDTYLGQGSQRHRCIPSVHFILLTAELESQPRQRAIPGFSSLLACFLICRVGLGES